MALINKLTEIADAIREKTGGTDPIALADMPSVISGIQSGGGDIDALIDGSITEVTSNAEKILAYSFYQRTNLTKARFADAIVVDGYAFYGCTSLNEINLPKVTNFNGSYILSKCTALTSVNLPLATSAGSYSFRDSASLVTANLPCAESIGFSSFDGCSKLETVNIPLLKDVESGLFKSCVQLKMVDLPLVKSIASNAFYTCMRMTALILRSETVCTLGSTNAFTNCTAYIYVPSSLIDSYKSATNWSTYAAQFRALEDYTVDGTITGALDKSKI